MRTMLPDDWEERAEFDEARDYSEDPEGLRDLGRAAEEKVARKAGAVGSAVEDLKALVRLIRAWAGGQYRRIPWSVMVPVIGAVIYFVNPFDLVPDFIPGLGYLDDAAVVALVANSIRSELRSFRQWEKQTRPRWR